MLSLLVLSSLSILLVPLTSGAPGVIEVGAGAAGEAEVIEGVGLLAEVVLYLDFFLLVLMRL